MQRTWLSQSLRLEGIAHRIEAGVSDESPLVLRRESLAVVRSVDELVVATRGACARHLRSARRRMKELRHQARLADSEAIALQRADAERDALVSLAAVSAALNEERKRLLDGAAALMSELARQTVKQLLLDVPHDWAARSSVGLLRDAWKTLTSDDEARLRVHPDAVSAVQAMAAEAGWSLTADATLARGHCVLVHAAGTLHADFSANVCALLNAVSSDAQSVTLQSEQASGFSPTEGSVHSL